MPNLVAYIALLLWPLVAVALFRAMPPGRALIATLLAGYLFLPEPPAQFDLPLFPPLGKHNIPAIMAFACLLWMNRFNDGLLPRSIAAKMLVLTFVFSPVLTVLTNPEPVFFGQVGLPGLGWKDTAALVLKQSFLILPLLMARQVLRSAECQREVLLALVLGGAAYSFLMVIELRLSPQLNNWIYGYYQHLFSQAVRAGGYRPVIFLYHGLWTAFFMMTAVVAAFALARSEQGRAGGKFLVTAVWLGLILVLAKSLGALVFAAALVPAVLFLTRTMQIRIALVIGLLAIAYPLMKGADVFPEDLLLAQAERVGEDRAHSLEFRFDNENTLLERAYEKPVFGWGSWGRNHILDPVSGNILTVTDGRWIIVIGVLGWVGFLAEFGLLVLPIFLLWRETSLAPPDSVSPYIAPLSLILAVNVADMLPNATLTPITWLLAGALLGYAEVLRERRQDSRPATLLRWQSIM